ncbi:MAG: class II glutamine amidotransferase [Deltaproteobacteria bacterium]|nr:class II glutamine amidotransferase [Deltaproteobacteria bacterium]
MARLVGLLANRADLPWRFAAAERRLGTASPFHIANATQQPWGYGLGFLQGGELLLSRRPNDDRRELDLAAVLGEVRSDLVVTHVRTASVSRLTSDNTHPFRYGEWLYADTGADPALASLRHRLISIMPEFLARGLRGDTGSELVFHLVLGALHRAGRLEGRGAPTEAVADALAAAFVDLARVADSEASSEAERAAIIKRNVIVASPAELVVTRGGPPVAYRTLVGREELASLFDDEGPLRLRTLELDTCRLVVVASDFDGDAPPPGWTPLAEGARMCVRRDDEPHLF